jgi:hypothetical protein
MRQRTLFWIAVAAQIAGLFTFGRWLLQTDFMFGHYTGPMPLLRTALAILGVGAGTALVWIGRAIYVEIRSKDTMTWTGAGIFGGLVLIALSVVTIFCGILGVAAILDDMDVL